MVNLNNPDNDGQSKYEDYWVTATYFIDEDATWDAVIGEVTLSKDITYEDMPIELEINGVTYKRED